ncbi:MAG: disulfide bond formation protein B [Patescibacteria group bacterium]
MSSVDKMAVIAAFSGISLLIALISIGCYGRRHQGGRLASLLYRHGVVIAFGVVAVSILGSLYFSEIANYEPCTLCWWQRVCIFPLAIILGIGWYRQDNGMKKYAMPLAIIGCVFAIYNSYIQQWPSVSSPCVFGGLVDCSTRYVFVLGFVTIPLLSLIALLIVICSLFFWRPIKASTQP